jgi:FtsZ-interacting cell division protein YlmF
MAQGKPGVFKKILNVIGIVDDGPRDYDGDYDAAYSRGSRPSTYVPPQQRSRTEETRRRTVVPDERRRYSAQPRASAYDEGYTVRRSTRAYEDDFDDGRQAYRAETRRTSEPALTRAPSRFSQNTAVAAVAPAPRPVPAASARTVMFSIMSLEECCEVIDSLIGGNIVLLTLDALDAKLTQRAVDTLSGAVFALHATIRKASDKTYLIAPRTVEVNETYDVERRF